MVKLLGIIHGVYGKNIFGGRVEDYNLGLDPVFLTEMENLPENARIGIEGFNEADWKELGDYTGEACLKNGFGMHALSFGGLDGWNPIINLLRSQGREIIFLENKQVYKKYIDALIKQLKWREKEIYQESKESNFDYNVKHSKHFSKLYKLEILARKIHEIDRDTAMLKAIKDLGIDVALVGKGHSDYWFAKREFVETVHGVKFDSYSSNEMMPDFVPGATRFLPFEINAVPNPQLLFDYTGLLRAYYAVMKGKITDKKPAYIGAWDLIEPAKGLFELFIEKNENGNVSGTIEDCLGTATFKGELSNDKFNFVKTYSTYGHGAYLKGITYEGKIVGDGEFKGHFMMEGFCQPFFMKRFLHKINPSELSYRFLELERDREKVEATTQKPLELMATEEDGDLPF